MRSFMQIVAAICAYLFDPLITTSANGSKKYSTSNESESFIIQLSRISNSVNISNI